MIINLILWLCIILNLVSLYFNMTQGKRDRKDYFQKGGQLAILIAINEFLKAVKESQEKGEKLNDDFIQKWENVSLVSFNDSVNRTF